MHNKEKFIIDEINRLIQFWGAWAAFFGAFFYIFLSLLDYIATPDNFLSFITLRLVGALFLMVIYIIYKKGLNRKYQLILIYSGVIISLCIIEFMIINFGGHRSPYYAGIFILIIVILGFIPLNLRHALIITIIGLLAYVVPILYFDKNINYRVFAIPVFFLASTFTIGNIWRYLAQKRLINELTLQYNLDKERLRLKEYSDKLEEYSHRLEDMVAERTKELVAANKKYAALFEHANDGILIIDISGKIIDVNHKFCELFEMDKSQLIGIHFWNLEHEKDDAVKLKRFEKLLSGKSVTYETQHVTSEDKKMFLDVSSRMIEFEGEKFIQSLYRDITEKKLLQEQLLQAQKMESIGILASGVAHDFNNLLTASLGHIELLLQFGRLDESLKEKMKTIENSIRKAGNLVSKLLSFARKDEPTFAPVNMN